MKIPIAILTAPAALLRYLTSISCDTDVKRHPLALPSFRIGMGARLLALLSLLLLGTAIHLQGQQQYTWAQSFGATSYGGDGKPIDDPFYGSGYDTAVGIAQMPDGGCVVAGQLDLPELYTQTNGSDHSGGRADAALVRYGRDGTIIWQEMIRQNNDVTDQNGYHPGPSHVYQVQTDAQGNIFICGGKGNPDNGGQLPFVAKFNSAGALIWQNGLTGIAYLTNPGPPEQRTVTGAHQFTSMGLTPDGGVVVGTDEYTPGNTHTVPIVCKFNSDGSLAFHSAFDEVPGKFVQYLGTSAVCASSDGKHYLALTDYNGMTALLIDGSGNLVSQISYPTDADEPPLQVTPTPDGGYVAISLLNGGFDLRKLDSSLKCQFQRFVSRVFYQGSGAFSASQISITKDGGYLIAGSASGDTAGAGSIGSPTAEAALMKLDGNGIVKFCSLLGGTRAQSGTFGFENASGGYNFATTTYSYSSAPNANYAKPDWWVVRADPNRRVQNFKDIVYELPVGLFVQRAGSAVSGAISDFTRVPNDAALPMTGSEPSFIFENTANNSAPNNPTVLLQAAPFLGSNLPGPQSLTVKSVVSRTDFYGNRFYSNHRLWRFEVLMPSGATNLTVRIQSNTLIAAESGWTDLPGGGQMTLVDPSTGLWELDTTTVLPEPQSPENVGLSFRAIAAAPSYSDSTSLPSDGYAIDNAPAVAAPSVAITTPANNDSSAVEGSDVQVAITAAAGANYYIGDVSLIDNGAVVQRGLQNSGQTFTATLGRITSGYHVLVAIASDNAGQQTASAPVAIFVSPKGGVNYTFNGSGDWFSPSSWTPNGVPGANDSANVSTGALTLSQDATVKNLTVNGGTIAGPGALTIAKSATISGGGFNTLTLNVDASAQVSVVGDQAKSFNGVTINNNGSFLVSGSGAISSDSNTLFGNKGHFSFTLQTLANSGSIASFAHFKNSGGTVSLSGGNLSAPGGYEQDGGETDLGAVDAGLLQGALEGNVTLNGGSLTGVGKVLGNLLNLKGFLSPGHSIGSIEVTGDYTQGKDGTLVLEVNSATSDQLQIDGAANLGGTLNVNVLDPAQLNNPTVATPITFGSVSGSFASVSSNAQVTMRGSSLQLSVDPTVAAPQNGQPLNIATRLQIQSGDNVLIGGFIITGPAGSTKKVLIRGIGPSLANFGVAGTIPDPFLELHKSDGSVVTNDNWQQAPNVAEIPSGFAPSNDLESIIYTTLSPGNYTAILKGAHGEAGVGLVEAYDFDTASTAKLANIATRGFVNTDDNVMIGGFIIGGTEPAKILVRAIGPSLIPFVQGALQATTLELHDANGGVISNDGWRSTQESEIQATTIPPTNDNEAAILATLVPGNYTAIVRGKNNTTGIAVVEAYNLQ